MNNSSRPTPTPRESLRNFVPSPSSEVQLAKADGPVPAPRHLLRAKKSSRHSSIFDVVKDRPESSFPESLGIDTGSGRSTRGAGNDVVINYKIDDDASSWKGVENNTSTSLWEERRGDMMEEFISKTFSGIELSDSEEQELFSESKDSSQTFSQEQPRLPPIPKPRASPQAITSTQLSRRVFPGIASDTSPIILNEKDDDNVHDFETVLFSQHKDIGDTGTATEESFSPDHSPWAFTHTSDHSVDQNLESVVNNITVPQKRVRFNNLHASSSHRMKSSRDGFNDHSTTHNVRSEMAHVIPTGRDPLTGLFSVETILKKIDERCNIVKKLRAKTQENQANINKNVSSIREHIEMSFRASLRNIRRDRTRLLKKGTLRHAEKNAKENAIGKTEDHGSPRHFSFIYSKAKEMVNDTMCKEKVGRFGFTISQQLRSLLNMDCYDVSSNRKLYFMEQYRWSIGRYLKRLKCVGVVGLSDTCVLAVADQREDVGVCFGLWSPKTSRYRKWQVVLPIKVGPLHSSIAVSSTLGTDAHNESVVVLAIGKTLYLILHNLLFRDKYINNSIVHCFKLKLGSCVSSIACVVGKGNYVAITCQKRSLVYLYDTHNEQIVQQTEFFSGHMSLCLGFAAERQSRIKFGILIMKGEKESFICMADNTGMIDKPMTRVAVNWDNLFPCYINYHVTEGLAECSVIFRNEAKKNFLSKFAYGRSTREIEFIRPLHYDKKVVGLTTLQHYTHLLVAIAFEDGRVLVHKIREVYQV